MHPLSKQTGILAALAALIVALASPDATAMIATLLTAFGLEQYAPIVVKLIGALSVLATLFAHSATGAGRTGLAVVEAVKAGDTAAAVAIAATPGKLNTVRGPDVPRGD